MSANTRSSSGALRAAAAIEVNHEWGRMEPQRIIDRAAIIDRETGTPALLAAVLAANELYARLTDREDRVMQADIDEAWGLAQDAINASNGDGATKEPA